MERRIVLQKAGDPDQYLQILQQNPAEVRALSDDLLINVTEFFRDPPVFEALKERVISRDPAGRSRATHPRLGSGMLHRRRGLLHRDLPPESMQDAGASFPVHIFGTDISERNIAKARAGIFAPSSRDRGVYRSG